MPLYRATVTKHDSASGDRWRNVYTVQTDTAINAMVTVTGLIVPAERSVTYTTTLYDEATVVNVASALDRRAASLGGEPGLLDVTGLGGPLPLYVTTLVTFPDNVRKPERKYVRGAYRNNMANGLWSAEWVAQMDANYSQVIFGELTIVGPSGERPSGALTSNIPTDRQLGWHRRTRPGFRRGWVPV